jgi:hypothetical protein
MKVEIGIEIRDAKLVGDLFETTQIKAGQEKTIAEGVSIQLKNYMAREAVDFPTIVNIVAYVGEHVALPIAVGILSRYLYDKLKDRKTSKVTINQIQVEIDAEKIEKLILRIHTEEHDE